MGSRRKDPMPAVNAGLPEDDRLLTAIECAHRVGRDHRTWNTYALKWPLLVRGAVEDEYGKIKYLCSHVVAHMHKELRKGGRALLEEEARKEASREPEAVSA